MNDIIRRTLIESKIQVLQNLQVYLGKEIETYTEMLKATESSHDPESQAKAGTAPKASPSYTKKGNIDDTTR